MFSKKKINNLMASDKKSIESSLNLPANIRANILEKLIKILDSKYYLKYACVFVRGGD